MESNATQPTTSQAHFEYNALSKIMQWVQEGKKTLTSKERREVLTMVSDHYSSLGLVLLVGFAMGYTPSDKKLGRPPNEIKKLMAKHFFIQQGRLPARGSRDGSIKKCEEYISQAQEANNDKDGATHHRNFVSHLLKDETFREEVRQGIADKEISIADFMVKTIFKDKN